jgi:hypothetical protein
LWASSLVTTIGGFKGQLCSNNQLFEVQLCCWLCDRCGWSFEHSPNWYCCLSLNDYFADYYTHGDWHMVMA